MKILVACESSGTVREAFRSKGHDAWSCDILPCDDGCLFHLRQDVAEVLGMGWDMMIAHPPCTDLAISGTKHFAEKIADGRQGRALDFVQMLMDAPIPMIAVENPVSVISSKIRKPDQIINPWQFGHPEQKKTCLWLKGLPLLKETSNVYDKMMTLPRSQRERLHYMSPGPNRWKERSKTFQGIALAMAEQWGCLTIEKAA